MTTAAKADTASNEEVEKPTETTGTKNDTSAVHAPFTKRQLAYFAKSFGMIAILYIVSKFAPSMPPVAIAVIWALLSAIASIGLAYLVVIKRTHDQFKYRKGGWRARLNEGRLLPLTASFIGAALLMAGLFFEMVGWGPSEWGLIVASVPIFFLVSLGMRRAVNRGWEPLFQASSTALHSSLIVGILLLLGYVLLLAFEPTVPPISATDAFLSAPHPFKDSPVALLTEADKANALIDGMTTYGLSAAAGSSPWWYYLLSAVIAASSFLGFANLLGMCSLELSELKRVFLPLESAKHPHDSTHIVNRFVAIACALPIALAIGFVAANNATSKAAESDEYTCAERFVRNQAGLAAAFIDGQYYDPEAVKELMEQSNASYEDLTSKTKDALISIVEDSCDKQIANVDGYLDWYYSLTADYNRLAQFFTGTIEEGMQEQIEARINEGIDGTAFDEICQNYEGQVASIKSELLGKLEEAKIDGVPEWLVVGENVIEMDTLFAPPEPTQKLLDFSDRMLASAGVGAVGGIVVSKVTANVLNKPFFKKITTQLAEALARKGLISSATSITGTLIAPGIGTIGGIGLGVLSDYLFVKADEAMNRDEYEQEIIAAIEESRADMIAGIQEQ